MKIIIASDIHGNLEALEALPRDADYFISAGDVVDYGPDTLSCIEFIQKNNWIAVMGNHDQAAAFGMECGCSQLMIDLSRASRKIVTAEFEERHFEFLRALPLEKYLDFPGSRFYITHAIPNDPYHYLSKDDEIEAIIDKIDADIIIWGHTHVPYIRKIGSKTVVNPGSVGQSRDSNPQASYAVWEDGFLTLCRVSYPSEKTIQKINKLQLADEFKNRLAKILSTGSIK